MLRELLSEEVFDVIVCSSLLDLITRAEGVRGEVAVVDVWRRRPESDGCVGDCLQAVAAVLPLVIITDEPWAYTRSPHAPRAVAVLPKPFSIDAVVAAVEQAAAFRQAERYVPLRYAVSALA